MDQDKRLQRGCNRVFKRDYKKKIRPRKAWVHKGTEFAGEFEKICNAQWMQIYSTLSETKTALAGCTVRSKKIYRYLEEYEYK